MRGPRRPGRRRRRGWRLGRTAGRPLVPALRNPVSPWPPLLQLRRRWDSRGRGVPLRIADIAAQYIIILWDVPAPLGRRGDFQLSNFADGLLPTAFLVGLLLASPLSRTPPSAAPPRASWRWASRCGAPLSSGAPSAGGSCRCSSAACECTPRTASLAHWVTALSKSVNGCTECLRSASGSTSD